MANYFTKASVETRTKVMNKVYGYMFLGLMTSAIVAALFAYIPEFYSLIYKVGEAGQTSLSVAGWVVLLSPLLLVFFFGKAADMGIGAMKSLFVIFSVLLGASLSSIFLVYTESSILMCFLITAVTFGCMSLYGYTTQKDLSSIGSLLLMALIGIIIASVVNLFLRSEMMDFIVSIIAVVVFVGLTAYDTQKIKEELSRCYSDEEAHKIAIFGALSLYLDFINMLLQILRLLGNKK